MFMLYMMVWWVSAFFSYALLEFKKRNQLKQNKIHYFGSDAALNQQSNKSNKWRGVQSGKNSQILYSSTVFE